MSSESDRRKTEGADKAPSVCPPTKPDTGTHETARPRSLRRFALDRLRRHPERKTR